MYPIIELHAPIMCRTA